MPEGLPPRGAGCGEQVVEQLDAENPRKDRPWDFDKTHAAKPCHMSIFGGVVLFVSNACFFLKNCGSSSLGLWEQSGNC